MTVTIERLQAFLADPSAGQDVHEMASELLAVRAITACYTKEGLSVLLETCNVLINRKNTSGYSDNLREIARVAHGLLASRENN
ncbi:TPA: hypothetical protein PPN70_004753 [Serratia rubidaea]|nr:hypothetical protein [Serratia rubidaea]HDJ1451339.1 hypothetical protein [Serratia rubidaea]HDJ1462282.1 hypothetical protein [Serratia rubidaea]HDJ2774856.1 hypothetical protein [Serratia rubidaea]